jgi:ribosomal protein S27AE
MSFDKENEIKRRCLLHKWKTVYKSYKGSPFKDEFKICEKCGEYQIIGEGNKPITGIPFDIFLKQMNRIKEMDDRIIKGKEKERLKDKQDRMRALSFLNALNQKSIKCPTCGGNTEFNSQNNRWYCPSCQRHL